MDLTRDQKELAKYLVNKSIELNEDSPPTSLLITSLPGGRPLLVRFDNYRQENVDSAEEVVDSLVAAGLLLDAKKNKRYTMTTAIYGLVESGFKPLAKEGWIKTFVNKRYLIALINTRFNHGELSDLCFDLSIDPENIGSDSAPREERVERLIDLMILQGRFGHLLREVDGRRPGVDWPGLFED